MNGRAECYPEWCPFPNNHRTGRESMMGVLSIVSLFLTLLNTFFFIRGKKSTRWILALTPIILMIILFILANTFGPS
jgi:hypothetical protein